MEAAGAVHVDDGGEVGRVPVEEELWRTAGHKPGDGREQSVLGGGRSEDLLVAVLQNALDGGSPHQLAQPGGRVPQQLHTAIQILPKTTNFLLGNIL